ncbi:hypothetical protein K7X08_010298 [Anisodus acutangulus]|uniref:Uncharacterized protein n=1 Tax=Anisodus acutangulus TaxID=402998 RepID=A0A9Q1RUD3_9SOLA|nr:hypothetical protein K7X08_010298 [Anisodus acutangulus]
MLGSQMEEIRGLILGLPIPPIEINTSSTVASYYTKEEMRKYLEEQEEIKTSMASLQIVYITMVKAYGQLFVDFDKEKKKNKSRDKLMLNDWRGFKEMFKKMYPNDRLPVEDWDDQEFR